MAMNWPIFKTRTLTAILFVAVVATAVLWNRWSFFLLFSVIHFGCWMEYQRMAGLMDPGYREITPFHQYGVMLAGWCVMLYFTNDAYRIFNFRLNELGWWTGLVFIFILPIIEILFASQIRLKNIGYSAFGLLYISIPCGLMIDLASFTGNLLSNGGEFGLSKPFDPLAVLLPIALIASIWINDTMAYIVGSLIGKTALSRISPKKTWEGTSGGIILSVLAVGFLFSSIRPDIIAPGIHFHVAPYHWFIIAGIAAVTGTLGDLLESKIKRMAGVKDSGKLLPGHGGFLDRFDSMLVAIPFVWLYVQIFLK